MFVHGEIRQEAKAAGAPIQATRPLPSRASRRAGRQARQIARPAPKPVVIDVHAHVLVPEVMKLTYEQSQYSRRWRRPGGMPEPLLKRMTELPLRLEEMDATGVDIQVISPSIMQQCTYGVEPEEALKMDRLGNDRVAEAVAQTSRPAGRARLAAAARRRALGRRSSSAACAISSSAASSSPRT